MNAPGPHIEPQGPSVAVLARTTALALVVAGVILVVAVLPAEYGVDPTGIGRRLGLTAIATPPLAVMEDPRPGDAPLVPIQNGPVGVYPAEFKLDAIDLVLEPFEYLEYKYQMEHGATMLYSWTSSAPLTQDFHGARATPPADGGPVEQSYDKADRQRAYGSFTAPFTGMHGWFWEHPGEPNGPITIRLTSSGYYRSAVETRMDRTTRPHSVRSPETVAPSAPDSGPGARP
jgi:hypothetical protein